MSHSHVCCLVHVVFATAERRPAIPEGMQERLYAYLGGIARENEISTLAIGGTDGVPTTPYVKLRSLRPVPNTLGSFDRTQLVF